jgi:hypothetical protein
MNSFNEQFPGNPAAENGMGSTTRGFWGNLGLIRPVAWVIGLVFFFGMQCLFWFVIWPQTRPDELAKLSEAGKICLPLLASSVGLAYSLLIGFVYVDAKRRGMRYVMWTWLAAVIPDLIGVILYFIMRDPMPTPCPKCNRLSAQSCSFFTSLGSALLRTRRGCNK